MGTRKVFTHSAATLSWIDPASSLKGIKLPEFDAKGKPGETLTFFEVTTARICRFSHLLTCSITVENGRIVERSVAPESGLHTRPSYKNTPPRKYHTRRSVSSWDPEKVTFVQTVGCRTQAPELIGRTTGSAVGDAVEDGTEAAIFALSPVVGAAVWALDEWLQPGKRVGAKAGRETAELMAFPPIWTTLVVEMNADGTTNTYLKAHSIFPSMTLYEAHSTSPILPTLALIWARKKSYNGVPHIDEWMASGWGKGNPWRIQDPGGVLNDSIR